MLYHKNHHRLEIFQICAHSFTAHFDFDLRRISVLHFEWPVKSDGEKKSTTYSINQEYNTPKGTFWSYLPSAHVIKLSAFFPHHLVKSVLYFWLISLIDETHFHRERCYFWCVFMARCHSSRCETGASFSVQKLTRQFAAAKQIWVQTCVCFGGHAVAVYQRV